LSDCIIKSLNEVNSSLYVNYLSRNKNSLIYYSLAYKKLLENLLGATSNYYLALEGGIVKGVMPTMSLDGKFGRVINSLPFYGSHGGPLADTPDIYRQLINYFISKTQDKDMCVASYISHPFIQADIEEDVNKKIELADYRIWQMTPLLASIDKSESQNLILSSIDSSARRNIKKSAKEGISVSEENDMLEFVYESHVEGMNEIGGNSKSHDFFEYLPLYFTAGSDYRIYVARKDGIPIAALLLLYYGEFVEYFVPVTRVLYRNSQPMAALLIQSMTEAANLGFKWWNWGGTWATQTGVYRFKKKWGAEEGRYDYHIYLNNSDILCASSDELLKAYPNFYTVPFNMLERK